MYLNMLQRLTKRRTQRRGDRSPLDDGLGITIRFAYPDDAAALRHLATLDSKPVPDGALLVAEVAGELWAAVSITDEGQPISDPFRYTAELVTLLQDRARQLTRQPRQRQASQRVRQPSCE
jgi:hypothetical protein